MSRPNEDVILGPETQEPGPRERTAREVKRSPGFFEQDLAPPDLGVGRLPVGEIGDADRVRRPIADALDVTGRIEGRPQSVMRGDQILERLAERGDVERS